MKHPYLLFHVLCTLMLTGSLAQNQTTKWMFGSYAGLDFMTSPPTSIPSPSMLAVENSASIADAAGNLLFYTNSENIWNSAHNIMANGGGLLGNFSSTQSMIIKRPGSATEYYVFYVDEEGGPDGLRYSTVDMSLAAGMGSVTAKNVLLYTPSSEKLAAVRHCNGTDMWLLSHDMTGSNFKAYLITAAGVSTTPVTTAIGTAYVYAGVNNAGWGAQLKFSPNGRKVGAVIGVTTMAAATASFEVYDFDNSTGVLSNVQNLGPNKGGSYGCEFSPDGTKFYASFVINSELVQWDLCANNATTSILSQFNGPQNYFSVLQLGPDGKIYVSRSSNSYLGVINNPNAAGAACNYNDMGPYLAPYNNRSEEHTS